MKSVLPADIPPDGRYDFTLLRTGMTKATRWADSHRVMLCLIDNGAFSGKRVSSKLDGDPPDVRFSGQLTVTQKAKVGGRWYEMGDLQGGERVTKMAHRYAICKILNPDYPESELHDIMTGDRSE